MKKIALTTLTFFISSSIFSQNLLEAEQWKAAGDFPKAFRNLLWIYDHGGRNDPGMVASLKDLMFEDGKKN
ncbi:MAG: hypothetical protein AAF391_13405, partial [Bacteroidota bacterium]